MAPSHAPPQVTAFTFWKPDPIGIKVQEVRGGTRIIIESIFADVLLRKSLSATARELLLGLLTIDADERFRAEDAVALARGAAPPSPLPMETAPSGVSTQAARRDRAGRVRRARVAIRDPLLLYDGEHGRSAA